MEVVKRDGKREPVYFDKISTRIDRIRNDFTDLKTIDPTKIAQKTIQNLYDGITTHELDDLSARVCASLSLSNHEYGKLGGRICISNLHKMTPDTFFEACNMLMNNHDKNNNINPLLDGNIYNIIEKNAELIESKIVKERDFLIDSISLRKYLCE